MENKSNKDLMINEVLQALQEQGEHLRDNKELTNMDTAERLDVLINVMHFLKDYDENIQVLDRYWLEKRQKEKFTKAVQESEDYEL